MPTQPPNQDSEDHKKLQVRPHRLEVPEDDPFKNDTIGRKPFAERIHALIDGITGGAVIAVDGEWGIGKSTFAKMLSSHLTNSGHLVVNYDAFENDYIEESFVGIFSSLKNRIEEKFPKGGAVSTAGILDAAKKVGGKLLLHGAGGLASYLTFGMISKQDIEKSSDAVSKAVGIMKEVSEEIVSEKLNEMMSSRGALHEFRDSLGRSVSRIREQMEGKQVVIIIDELDRCRPPFAVGTLETIKHLFYVDGICIIYFMNRGQIEESIKGCYGQTIDARAYLQKFVDISLSIGTGIIPGDYYSERRSKYIDDLNIKFGFKDTNNTIKLKSLIWEIAVLFRLKPREIEQIFSHATVCLLQGSVSDLDERNMAIVANLAFVRYRNPGLFRDYLGSNDWKKCSTDTYQMYKKSQWYQPDAFHSADLFVEFINFAFLPEEEFRKLGPEHLYHQDRFFSLTARYIGARASLLAKYVRMIDFT